MSKPIGKDIFSAITPKKQETFVQKEIKALPSADMVSISDSGEITSGCDKSSNTPITFMYDSDKRENIKNINLQLSIQKNDSSIKATLPMHDDASHGDIKEDDSVFTATVKLPENQGVKWDVTGDIVNSKGEIIAKNKSLVAEERELTIDPSSMIQKYATTTLNRMGVHKVGEDGISFMTWSPKVGKDDLKNYRVFVELQTKDGYSRDALPMTKDEKTGNWSLALDTGWKKMEGMAYRYAVKDKNGSNYLMSEGHPVIYSDPYARYLQGQQRGLERLYVDPILGIETGWYDDSGSGGCNFRVNPQWGRFTVNSHPDADSVKLVFRDVTGRQLSKNELLQYLGEPQLKNYNEATDQEKRNTDVLNRWGVDSDHKVTEYRWTNSVDDDGSINMTKVQSKRTNDAWVSTVNGFEKLVGLTYEFKVYKDGQLVGDKDKDGVLNKIERAKTSFNDPYSNKITSRPGSERLSLIKESNYKFKYDDVPRLTTDPAKYVIFEAHVGSFMGPVDNADPCTFQDMINNLSYIEKLGANTIELMPTAEFGGRRDWGYTTDFYFAGAESYGFEVPREKAIEYGVIKNDQDKDQDTIWVDGTDAIKIFVDEAHKKGFTVLSDVIYNHVGGKADGDNPLWGIDGDKNSFFRWWDNYLSNTPWGAKPNFSADGVKQFFANNAMAQIDELHFDGTRYDFVQIIHNTGSDAEKGEGVNALRKMNKTINIFKPNAYRVAEDFSGWWKVTEKVKDGGLGFNAAWNDHFHHDLVKAIDGSNPEFNMDRLMEGLTCHVNVADWSKAVVYSHSHDEVGNSGQWVIRMAAHSQDNDRVMEQYPRNVARSAAALTLTSPGVPMIFQGEEILSNADYKHGVPSTWGTDVSWLDFEVTPDKLSAFEHYRQLPKGERGDFLRGLKKDEIGLFEKYEKMTPEQRVDAKKLSYITGNFKCYHDLIKLRGSSPALEVNTEVNRLYTHNNDRILAYTRKKDDEEFIVATNFSGEDRYNYNIHLPEGKWEEVFNSNAEEYGGTGLGNTHATLGQEQSLTLPKGSTIILKKVGPK